MSSQPLVGVGLVALGTMPIIAGMIGVVVGADTAVSTLRTSVAESTTGSLN